MGMFLILKLFSLVYSSAFEETESSTYDEIKSIIEKIEFDKLKSVDDSQELLSPEVIKSSLLEMNDLLQDNGKISRSDAEKAQSQLLVVVKLIAVKSIEPNDENRTLRDVNGLFFMMKEHMPSLEKSCSSLEDKIADRLKKKTKEPKTPNPMELLGNPPLGGAMGFNVSVTNNYPALERVVVEDLNFAGGSIVRDFCKQEINGVDSVEDTPSTSGPDIPDLLDKVTSFSNSIFGNLERAMDSGRKECDKKERKEKKDKTEEPPECAENDKKDDLESEEVIDEVSVEKKQEDSTEVLETPVKA